MDKDAGLHKVKEFRILFRLLLSSVAEEGYPAQLVREKRTLRKLTGGGDT